VPNKTIYVSDSDLPLFQRAQDIFKGNLSMAITTALRRLVEVDEGRKEGFDEIIVRVGPPNRKVRFVGVLLGEWMNSTSSKFETFRVYRSRTGRFVVHIDRSAEFTTVDAEGKPGGWRVHLGLGNFSYGMAAGESTVEVVPTVEELRDKIPPQLFEMVSGLAQRPVIEDLDI
jgi:EXLDI family protein